MLRYDGVRYLAVSALAACTSSQKVTYLHDGKGSFILRSSTTVPRRRRNDVYRERKGLSLMPKKLLLVRSAAVLLFRVVTTCAGP